MSICSTCGSAGTSSKHICIICHEVRMQEVLDTVKNLQRELRTVTTQLSFCKLALQLKLGKNVIKKETSTSPALPD